MSEQTSRPVSPTSDQWSCQTPEHISSPGPAFYHREDVLTSPATSFESTPPRAGPSATPPLSLMGALSPPPGQYTRHVPMAPVQFQGTTHYAYPYRMGLMQPPPMQDAMRTPVGSGRGRPILGRVPEYDPNACQTPPPRQPDINNPTARRVLFPPRSPAPPPPPPSTMMDPQVRDQLYAHVQVNRRTRNRMQDPNSPGRSCKFCKNNGETYELFSSHVLRNPVTGVLICPVLRHHECEICGLTGDDAHTRNYCPVLKKQLRNKVDALPVMLKRTRRQSDGSCR